MKEKHLIEDVINVISATIDDVHFIHHIFNINRDILHSEYIDIDSWRRCLEINDPDECHFLVYKGAVPVGYMKINGLENSDTAWISILAVDQSFQRQGIGSRAIKFAQDFLKNKGFSKLAIQTDPDNIPAQKCYTKIGFELLCQGEKYKYIKPI